MKGTRRDFIQKSGMLGLGILPASLSVQSEQVRSEIRNYLSSFKSNDVASDESFWEIVRKGFDLSSTIINLNNAGLSPTLRETLVERDKNEHFASQVPTYYQNRVLSKQRNSVKRPIAKLCSVEPDTIALSRNATESMNTVIKGFNWKPEDEILLSRYDYSSIQITYRQLKKRYGVKLVYADFDLPNEDDQQIIQAYKSKITGRTKLIHLTHMINWNGRILPVKPIIQFANELNIFSLVDGAQTLGQTPVNLLDLDCDCFAASLHKWACAPFGTGMLYLKKKRIPEIWPLYPAADPLGDSITKFEHYGTISTSTELAIENSLKTIEEIGISNIESRLKVLKNYWIDALSHEKGFNLQTSISNDHSVGIAHFGLKGKETRQIESRLFKEFSIHALTIQWEKLDGLRISPHIYTSIADLDKFIHAVQSING